MSLQVEYQGSYSDQRLQQLGHYMKELSTLRLLLVCVLTPLPCLFLSLIKEVPPMAPPEAGVYGNGVFFARSWAVMADPSLFVEVQRQLVVYQCQTTLPFVYPLYIYGFVSLTGWNQVIFVAVLPIIQIIAKNWISRALGDDDDQKPQCVIFVVEVYNALYVSSVLQTASSWASTAAVMVVDLVQFWVSMIDIIKVFEGLSALMAKIPCDHPLAKENFVQLAVRLMAMEAQTDSSNGRHDLELEAIFSQEERVRFIRKAKRVLFIAEYLLLVEYVEVVLPFAYCLHQFILFHMHNVLVLKRKLGYSSLQQLAFVLDAHAGVVQTKLNLIFVYIMQVSLTHLGTDFSFKFSWLKSTNG
ncbi:hypothetical protein PHYSODRAFT_317784 [Phytophthora sojae]|uniref:Uncharacterized protein n=1 Tax=Phytophthora sojae (strain P6497) TaxID=1094619 RepID=G5A141_PHYSP|nr:hypothetical protein PHYSODRAFT_317784 [Phytophthora sojae]EGZ10643.1 hypothetical protein PHYSODRAFT_317784 [Phytophthora sojae]|eukprot:XP_009533388.1 hypothetical protein PHYSODRAFT_317784 [Phytophthora sojae]